MNDILSTLKAKAAELGGASLAPKRIDEKTLIAFTFHDRTAAEKLVDWARTAGVPPVSFRSTYHAFLATFQL